MSDETEKALHKAKELLGGREPTKEEVEAGKKLITEQLEMGEKAQEERERRSKKAQETKIPDFTKARATGDNNEELREKARAARREKYERMIRADAILNEEAPPIEGYLTIARAAAALCDQNLSIEINTLTERMVNAAANLELPLYSRNDYSLL
ncbi:MAG: hypothetical protein AAF387_18895, partial [Pseudomonadota bacterium]